MKPQLKEQFSKLLKFAHNATEIAKGITLDYKELSGIAKPNKHNIRSRVIAAPRFHKRD